MKYHHFKTYTERDLDALPPSPMFSEKRMKKFWNKFFKSMKPQPPTGHISISVSHALITLLTSGARSASVYLTPKSCVKITRQFKPDKRNSRESFVLTIGAPNFAGRKFVKDCQKAGESFPVRKVQLKFWPKKRK